jgi:hypothetical protein
MCRNLVLPSQHLPVPPGKGKRILVDLTLPWCPLGPQDLYQITWNQGPLGNGNPSKIPKTDRIQCIPWTVVQELGCYSSGCIKPPKGQPQQEATPTRGLWHRGRRQGPGPPGRETAGGKTWDSSPPGLPSQPPPPCLNPAGRYLGHTQQGLLACIWGKGRGQGTRASEQKCRYSQVPVAHTHNPSYSGDRDQEDRGSKPAPNSSGDPISKIPNIKQGWWSGSSGRVPA